MSCGNKSVRLKVLTFFAQTLHKLFPGWNVVLAKQDIAVEFDKYIVIDLLAERGLGVEERWNEDAGEVRVVELVEATLSITGIGRGAIETLSMIETNLCRPTIVDEFFVANIAVNRFSETQDISELLDSRKWQEMGNIDLTISYDRQAIDEPGWFDKVMVGGLLLHGGKDKPKTGKIEFISEIEIDKEI